MRNAPSVSYPVGRCRFFAAILILLSLAALALQSGWVAWVKEPSRVQQWAGWVGLGVWVAWVIWAIRHWRESPQGSLDWDAHARSVSLVPDSEHGAWRWRDAKSAEATSLAAIELAVDLQVVMLLRLAGTARQPGWIWAERWREPSRWNDLRRALRSSGA